MGTQKTDLNLKQSETYGLYTTLLAIIKVSFRRNKDITKKLFITLADILLSILPHRFSKTVLIKLLIDKCLRN
eukprot:GAHX01002555.1.p3 GENE.GAHX01002555.1~~GAHX01002555.1.p3  ORF type:complete len:73 (-),score=9.23 GAHX01002555.1:1558-1776(-)